VPNRGRSLLPVLLIVVASIQEAAAETVRLVDDEGTVHYTNAPNDPRYRRLSGASDDSSLPAPPVVARPPAGIPVGSPVARFTAEIREAARRYGVPERLVEAVIRAESGFKATAVSRKGARGLMQLMPDTAALLGVRDSFDPRENIDGGVRHLKGLMERYANDLRLALAAYNAGEGAVNRHGDVPPYPETQQYVMKILREYGDATVSVPVIDVPLSAFYRYEDSADTVTYTNIPRPRSVSERSVR
jgi:soluble lytic murein transglycosylase-like protein